MDELEKLKKQWQDDYEESQKRFYDDIQQIKMAYSVAIPTNGYSIDDAVMDGSAVYPTEEQIIQGGLRLAGPNQLNLVEKIDIDVFNAMGEDNIKSKSKIDISVRIASEITSKTKFTMLKEHDQVTIRAKVYAFNEAELIAFIEKIVKIAK